TVRSRVPGIVTVRAGSGEFGTLAVRMEFAWPWVFLVLAVLGGIVGGILKDLQLLRTGIRFSIRRHLRICLDGALTGLVVAALWAGGYYLAQLRWATTFSEVGVFVVAVFGAFVGLPYIATSLFSGHNQGGPPDAPKTTG